MAQTDEKAFESYVETILLNQAGWLAGDLAEWDVERALFPERIYAFLQDTQPKLWEEMRKLHGVGLESLLTTTLVKELDSKGSLHILRHGFKFYGKTFRLGYFKPAHELNQEVLDLYAKNRLVVIRQVPCHPAKNDTVDLVFAVNGLPVATCELKNPGTHQN
jgi:type I restriction enzyme R subunit